MNSVPDNDTSNPANAFVIPEDVCERVIASANLFAAARNTLSEIDGFLDEHYGKWHDENPFSVRAFVDEAKTSYLRETNEPEKFLVALGRAMRLRAEELDG